MPDQPGTTPPGALQSTTTLGDPTVTSVTIGRGFPEFFLDAAGDPITDAAGEPITGPS